MESLGTPNVPHIQLSPSLSYCLLAILGWLFFVIILLVAAYWINVLCLPAIVILGMAFYRFWYLRNTIYILTKETLKIRTGIFNYTLITLELYRVKDYVVTQNIIMRILRIMTLALYTTDKQDFVISLTGIPQSGLSDTVRELVQQARAKSKIIEIN
uniref:PH domain-containing protein n=1 Tax=Pedobacter sp. TaxID=1411316 RepID=UPI0015EEA117|nr:PH domain-containing protein [Pedobacter sp.]